MKILMRKLTETSPEQAWHGYMENASSPPCDQVEIHYFVMGLTARVIRLLAVLLGLILLVALGVV